MARRDDVVVDFGCRAGGSTNQQSGASQPPSPAARVPSEQPPGVPEIKNQRVDAEPLPVLEPFFGSRQHCSTEGRIDGDGTRKQYLIRHFRRPKRVRVRWECSTTAELSLLCQKSLGTVWLLAFVDANGKRIKQKTTYRGVLKSLRWQVQTTWMCLTSCSRWYKRFSLLSPKAGTGAPPEGKSESRVCSSTQDGRSSLQTFYLPAKIPIRSSLRSAVGWQKSTNNEAFTPSAQLPKA